MVEEGTMCNGDIFLLNFLSKFMPLSINSYLLFFEVVVYTLLLEIGGLVVGDDDIFFVLKSLPVEIHNTMQRSFSLFF